MQNKKPQVEEKISRTVAGFEPKSTEQMLWFLPEGKSAKMVNNVDKIRKDGQTYYRFYVRPTPMFKWSRNISEEEPGYDPERFWWVKDIPEHLVINLDMTSPKCMTYGVFCNWDTTPDNPFKASFEGQLLTKIKYLKQEVKIRDLKIAQQQRIISRMAMGDFSVLKQMSEDYFQTIAQTDTNEMG